MLKALVSFPKRGKLTNTETWTLKNPKRSTKPSKAEYLNTFNALNPQPLEP